MTNDHYYQNVSIYSLFRLDWNASNFFNSNEAYGYIKIGSDVWIGRGCRLKNSNKDKPLVIGDGAVIAADSVVVKDVPPFAIVGGNPAKIIKYRFDKKVIESLQRIAWWNWDIEKIYKHYHLFNNPQEFVKQFNLKR